MKKAKNILYSLHLAIILAPTVSLAAFDNPLRSDINSVGGFVQELLLAATYILFPIGVLFVVYAGFMFVRAQGNTTKLSTAKENIVWVLIGMALILGAAMLATILQDTVNQITR
jgi:uncharacterized membrane protein YidH (DUF202 family)